MIRRYVHNLLISLDQLGSAVTGGDPDETISSRVGKASLAGAFGARQLELVIDAIFAVVAGQRGHCRDAVDLATGKDRIAKY